jgi:hypothetical protein
VDYRFISITIDPTQSRPPGRAGDAQSYGHEQRHIINGFRIAAFVAEALDAAIDALNPMDDKSAQQKAAELENKYQEIANELLKHDKDHDGFFRHPQWGAGYPPIGTFPDPTPR